MLYIEHNTSELQADICTGVRGLEYYDNMSHSFPFADVVVLKSLCLASGLQYYLRDGVKHIADWIIEFRENRHHHLFCEELASVIELVNIPAAGTRLNRRSAMIGLIERHQSIDTFRQIRPCDKKMAPEISLDNIRRLRKNLARVATKTNRSIRKPKDEQNRRYPMNTQNEVFVIHGRNIAINMAMFEFLRALNLKPIEWGHAVDKTGHGSPNISDVLDAVIKSGQAIIALFTDDENVKLRKELADTPRDRLTERQPRPNVLFEVGLAYGRCPERIVIVECGAIRPISDLIGRNVVRINNSAEKRTDLAARLKTIGCPVDQVGNQWLKAGNFEP